MLNFPEWADVIAIDPDGKVFAFQEDCYWDGLNWIPVDDFDGLRYEVIARLLDNITPAEARRMYFRRVEQKDLEPYVAFSAALPQAK